MFIRTFQIDCISSDTASRPAPLAHIDSFAMRNFTNDQVFDDTLPIADGLMEAGHRIPIDRLQAAMEDWFRRKSYLKPGEQLRITEIEAANRR